MSKLNESDIVKLVSEFYARADESAPLSWFLPLIDDENFEMVFGENVFKGHAGFEEFYRNLTGRQFDRVHTITDVKVKIEGDSADVVITLNSKAHVWRAPLPKSMLMDTDAVLRWTMKISPKTGTPVITYYSLDAIEQPAESVVIDAKVLFTYPVFYSGPWHWSINDAPVASQ